MITTRTRIACAAAAVAAALTLTACSSSDGDDATKSEAPATASADKADADASAQPDAKRDVKITKSGIEDHETWGPGAYVVHYTITNNGKSPADYFAQFEFLDKDGDVLGSTGVTADKLGPGKSKTADASPVESEIENGKPSDIKKVRVSQVDRT